ncbi:MAG TPA: hypothetical protein VMU87_02995 [Stellaceae bacterium]|nr:hypothetical protein [Stellaceae bacterium]
MGNFVIVYHWREGATALTDLLSKHPNVCVPLFEEADQHHPNAFATPENIHVRLDALFATGDLESARSSLGMPGGVNGRVSASVGFKWRIWGEPERIAEVLRKHDVTVFHVFRLNALEWAVSRYFSTCIVPALEPQIGIKFVTDVNPQFGFATLTREEQDAVRQVLHAYRFAVPADFVAASMKELWAFKENVCTTYMDVMHGHGVPVHAIFYEDFVRRRDVLLQYMCRALALDPVPLHECEPWYQKVASENLLAQVENIESLRASGELRALQRSYHDMIRGHHPLALEFGDDLQVKRPAAAGRSRLRWPLASDGLRSKSRASSRATARSAIRTPTR